MPNASVYGNRGEVDMRTACNTKEDLGVESSSKTASVEQTTGGRCLVAHCLVVFSALSLDLLRNSRSGARPALGQLTLTTSPFFGHQSDIPSNTFVDFSTIAESREVVPVSLTVELPCGSRPENSGLFPVRITLSFFLWFPAISVSLGRGYQGYILLAREAVAGDDCGNELVQTIASRKVYRRGREDGTSEAPGDADSDRPGG